MSILRGRILILCIGHRLRSDDGVGPYIADALNKKLSETKDTLVLNAESAPEVYVDVMRDFKPDVVLVIDAVNFGGKPGEVVLLKLSDMNLNTTAITTHSIPLPILMKLASIDTSKVYILGIQPKNLDIGMELSPEVREVAERIIYVLLRVLRRESSYSARC